MMSKEKLQEIYEFIENIIINYDSVKKAIDDCEEKSYIGYDLRFDKQTETILKSIVYAMHDKIDIESIIYRNRNKNLISELFSEEMVVG